MDGLRGVWHGGPFARTTKYVFYPKQILFGTDPVAMSAVKKQIGDKIRYEESNYTAAEGADALALITEWNEFREPDYGRMKKMMRQPVVFDGRNIYSAAAMKAQGFTYFSIGRSR